MDNNNNDSNKIEVGDVVHSNLEDFFQVVRIEPRGRDDWQLLICKKIANKSGKRLNGKVEHRLWSNTCTRVDVWFEEQKKFLQESEANLRVTMASYQIPIKF